MRKYNFEIIDKNYWEDDIFFLKLTGDDLKKFSFKAGQYVKLTNPTCKYPREEHIFSIASSPHEKKYLEFCIRVYGKWTEVLSKIKIGESICFRGPFGHFTYRRKDQSAVFLIGGTGITPVVSILRSLNRFKEKNNITLIYGYRNKKIIYQKEIEGILKKINGKVVYVLSDLKKNEKWKGYRGFIDEKILLKEVDFKLKPAFYLSGPKVFVAKMKQTLAKLKVEKEKIREENV